MRNQSGVVTLLLIAAFGAPLANASPIDYTIDFTTVDGFGVLPTAGSFAYDPGTQTFSDFTVTWDGINLDLTDGANDPNIPGGDTIPCLDGSSGAAATFLFLTACEQPVDAGNPTWYADCCTDGETFIQMGYNSYECDINFDSDPLVDDSGSRQAQGDFSTQVIAPEPGSYALMLVGSCLLVRKRGVGFRHVDSAL
jgi:hypothetical protein